MEVEVEAGGWRGDRSRGIRLRPPLQIRKRISPFIYRGEARFVTQKMGKLQLPCFGNKVKGRLPAGADKRLKCRKIGVATLSSPPEPCQTADRHGRRYARFHPASTSHCPRACRHRLACRCQPILEDKHRVTERERIAFDRGRVVRPDGFELLDQLFLASRRNAVQKSHQMLMRSVVSRAGPTERTPSWPPTRSRMRLMYAFAFSGRAA